MPTLNKWINKKNGVLWEGQGELTPPLSICSTVFSIILYLIILYIYDYLKNYENDNVKMIF